MKITMFATMPEIREFCTENNYPFHDVNLAQIYALYEIAGWSRSEIATHLGYALSTVSTKRSKMWNYAELAEMLFEAWFKNDKSKLDAIKILQKFEFVDGPDENTCLARLEEDVMIAINNFTGEAGGYLGFEVDIHYANKSTTGTMPKADGETITFTPDSAA